MTVHLPDSVTKAFNNITLAQLIQTVDTDLVVFAVAAAKLLVAFGTAKSFRHMMWFLSSFSTKGKKLEWITWMSLITSHVPILYFAKAEGFI